MPAPTRKVFDSHAVLKMQVARKMLLTVTFGKNGEVAEVSGLGLTTHKNTAFH